MSTKPTTAEDFDAIAPYPTDPDTATADAFARNYAVLAQANFTRSLEGPTADVRHGGTVMMLGLYSVVSLLRAMTKAAGTEAADAAARELLEDLAAPHCIGPTIWGWLNGYGIDPSQIDALVSGLKEMQAGPEMAIALTHVQPLAVWDASVPPGGMVCATCRVPVESEPCPDHGPTP